MTRGQIRHLLLLSISLVGALSIEAKAQPTDVAVGNSRRLLGHTDQVYGVGSRRTDAASSPVGWIAPFASGTSRPGAS